MIQLLQSYPMLDSRHYKKSEDFNDPFFLAEIESILSGLISPEELIKTEYDNDKYKHINDQIIKRLVARDFGICSKGEHSALYKEAILVCRQAISSILNIPSLTNYKFTLEPLNELSPIAEPLFYYYNLLSTDAEPRLRFECARMLVMTREALRVIFRMKQYDTVLADLYHDLYRGGIISSINEGLLIRDVYSIHDADTLECFSAGFSKAKSVDECQRVLKTSLAFRSWHHQNFQKGSPVFFTDRRKKEADAVLKLMRSTDSQIRTKDFVGIRAVLEDASQVDDFVKDLIIKSEGKISLTEIDTKILADKSVELFKAVLQYSGMLFEVQVMGLKSYFNYNFRLDIAHDIYSLKRLFDTDLISLLFPKTIYGYDWKICFTKILEKQQDYVRFQFEASEV